MAHQLQLAADRGVVGSVGPPPLRALRLLLAHQHETKEIRKRKNNKQSRVAKSLRAPWFPPFPFMLYIFFVFVLHSWKRPLTKTQRELPEFRRREGKSSPDNQGSFTLHTSFVNPLGN